MINPASTRISVLSTSGDRIGRFQSQTVTSENIHTQRGRIYAENFNNHDGVDMPAIVLLSSAIRSNKSNFSGSTLTGCTIKCTGSDFSETTLIGATIHETECRFDRANLSGANIQFSDKASYIGANLTGVTINGFFVGANLRNAQVSGLHITKDASGIVDGGYVDGIRVLFNVRGSSWWCSLNKPDGESQIYMLMDEIVDYLYSQDVDFVRKLLVVFKAARPKLGGHHGKFAPNTVDTAAAVDTLGIAVAQSSTTPVTATAIPTPDVITRID